MQAPLGRRRTTRSLLLAAALLLGLYVVVDDLVYYFEDGILLFDAHAYWTTGQDGYLPYALDPGYTDAYMYSPAFAQILTPISWLAWPVFATIWVGLELAAFLWLLRPLGVAWTAVLLVWCLPELVIGNIYGMLAVAIVLALTGRPQAWALPILTKPVLGIGVVWHLVRRDWRGLALSIGTTLTIVIVSYLVDPRFWVAWMDFLSRASATAPSTLLPARVAVATLVIIFAAVRGLPWMVPFALLLALPSVAGPSILTILTAVPRLWFQARSTSATPVTLPAEVSSERDTSKLR